MTAPITKAHRLAVARAWADGDANLSIETRRWIASGVADYGEEAALERLAQLVADAEGRPKNFDAAEAVIRFLDRRGGFDAWWEDIDRDTRQEIKEGLAELLALPKPPEST